eukprot:GGOE01014143.1.p1 GENE.GGOE01014143.1~~GGOE01014143.1.p1  ORF type:complete len:568 (-),score=104.76 GGOE01014143.1:179-1720(-)
MKEKRWRQKYWQYFVKAAQLAAISPANNFTMARAGLSAAQEQFEFIWDDGMVEPLYHAVLDFARGSTAAHAGRLFGSISILGKETFHYPQLELTVRGKVLQGTAVVEQVEEWVRSGVIEPSAGHALTAVVSEAGTPWLDLRGQHFVLLGAASAMCPLELLLKCGATVYAVDLPRPALWKRIAQLTLQSPGQLVVPVSVSKLGGVKDGSRVGEADLEWLVNNAGCDLLADAPAIAHWIVRQAPEQRLVLGTYAYLDGALFVRVAVTADAIVAAVCEIRGGANSPNGVALAHLLSPTEVHCVPEAAYQDACARARSITPHSLWEQPIRWLSQERYLEPNWGHTVQCADGRDPPLRLQDCLVWQQGPNYAMAKQLQKWRAILSREAGHVVSATVGPATLTVSVMHNRLVAAGMMGCRHFGVEAFEVETSARILGAILLWDLRAGRASAAHPDHPLRSPLELFGQNACHGGAWRSPFKANSYTEVSAVLYFLQLLVPWSVAAAGGVGLLLTVPRSRL